MADERQVYRLRIERLKNNTYVASVDGPGNYSSMGLISYPADDTSDAYDSEGALYYVVAVVFLYGFSIILMIGFLIKKNEADAEHGVTTYMSEMDKLRRLERRQEKHKTRLAILNPLIKSPKTRYMSQQTVLSDGSSPVASHSRGSASKQSSSWSLTSTSTKETDDILLQVLTSNVAASSTSEPFTQQSSLSETRLDAHSSVELSQVPSVPPALGGSYESNQDYSSAAAAAAAAAAPAEVITEFVPATELSQAEPAENERVHKLYTPLVHLDTLPEEEEDQQVVHLV